MKQREEGRRSMEIAGAGHAGLRGSGEHFGFHSRCEGSCQGVASRGVRPSQFHLQKATPSGRWGALFGDCCSRHGGGGGDGRHVRWSESEYTWKTDPTGSHWRKGKQESRMVDILV